MKTTIKNPRLFWSFLLMGITQVFSGISYYFSTDYRIVSMIMIPCGILIIFSAFWDRKAVWEITKEDGRYKIHRNEKLLFVGDSDDLFAITYASSGYGFYPHDQKPFSIPMSAADDSVTELYQNYRVRKEAEQVAASDR